MLSWHLQGQFESKNKIKNNLNEIKLLVGILDTFSDNIFFFFCHIDEVLFNRYTGKQEVGKSVNLFPKLIFRYCPVYIEYIIKKNKNFFCTIKQRENALNNPVELKFFYVSINYVYQIMKKDMKSIQQTRLLKLRGFLR